jgi:acyl-CoA synthetase (AMP-forming)/AMP-acid ligase II
MLVEVLRTASQRFPDRVAFALAGPPGAALSFADLDALSDEVAAGMAARGVREGDVVALLLDPGLEYPVCYLAAAKLGAVTAGISTRLTEPERAPLLGLVEPRLVVADHPAEHPAAVSVARADDGQGGEEVLGELRLRGEAPPPLDPDPDRPVAVVFTSGTTGPPKGAVFCGRQIAAVTAVDVGSAWGGGGRALASTPLSHLGPMTKLAGTLQKGATTFVTRRWHPREALALTRTLGLSTIGGIPTQLALMLAVADDGAQMPALRLVVIGGGPASPGLVRRIRHGFGVPVVVRYSCTEAAIGCGTAPDDPDEDAEWTVGRALPGVEVAVRDGSGEVAAAGEVGEVVLRSPAVMSTYHRDPAATRAVFTEDGFVRTGGGARTAWRTTPRRCAHRDKVGGRWPTAAFPDARSPTKRGKHRCLLAHRADDDAGVVDGDQVAAERGACAGRRTMSAAV